MITDHGIEHYGDEVNVGGRRGAIPCFAHTENRNSSASGNLAAHAVSLCVAPSWT